MTDKFNVEAQILPEDGEEEIWRPALQFADRYDVSNFGNIKYRKTGRIRSISHDNIGYPIVHLKIGSKVYSVYIHRLVCSVFNGPPTPEKNICDHIDRCIVNNYYKNLRWTDASGNSLNHKPIIKRENSVNNTPIVFLDLNGQFMYRFDSILEAHKILGISINQIQQNLLGVRKPFKNGYFRTEKDYLSKI